MKKANKKILSIMLVVMMLMSTFTMMFSYAEGEQTEETVTTPKAYDSVDDGEKLWDVDFSSEYFTPVDDTATVFVNNGITYSKKGVAGSTAKSLWRKSLADGATVVEQNGAALKIDGAVAAVGTEGDENYVPAVPADNTSSDQKYIGQINAYDLANKTYTYEIDYFRKGVIRSNIYFSNGAFAISGEEIDAEMPNLGVELHQTVFKLKNGNDSLSYKINDAPKYVTDEVTGETTISLKIVLQGGEKIEDKILFNGRNQNLSSTNNVKHWIGDVIPVTFSIYASVPQNDGSVKDVRVARNIIYQPADVKLVLGIGEYNNLTEGQYYGIKNVSIYKGDVPGMLNDNFTNLYNLSAYGQELTTFDPKSIVENDMNNVSNYNWTNRGGVTVDSDGTVNINRESGEGVYGAYTPHPFGRNWDIGYYQMEMTVNNMQAFKIGVMSIGDDARIGFDMLPNGTAESFSRYSIDNKAYLSAEGNAANMWVSAGDSLGNGVINNDDIKTTVYDTFTAGAGEEPEDPRNVRDYGANRANVKIVYNCEENIITLYEKCGGKWIATSAIDYSGAVELGHKISLVLDFTAYYNNSNVSIKGVTIKKGMDAAPLYYYHVDGFGDSTLLARYHADFIDEMTDKYKAQFGLDDLNIGWTADGTNAIGDYEDFYKKIEALSYAPYEVKLAPVMKYDTLATDAVLRGVQFAKVGDTSANYNVRFIAALGDVSKVAAIKFDVVKKVGDGEAVESTIEVTRVSKKLSANGLSMSASLIGGEYVAAASLTNEAAQENVAVTYEVSVSTVAIDGTVTKGNTVTYTFLNGEYVVLN